MTASATRTEKPAKRGVRRRRGRGALQLILIGTGAFLMAAGLLVRVQVAPQLMVAPTDVYEKVTLTAQNATYFDQGALAVRSGATLTYTVTVRGDTAAATRRNAVWDSFGALEDLQRGYKISISRQRLAFDRRTAQLANCCGAALDGNTGVRMSGIGTFWPVGVSKRTYQVFDPTTKRAWPAIYTGGAVVGGIDVHRFTQRVPATVTEQMPGVPSSLLGLPGKKRDVPADRYYESETTFLVDPRTGIVVDREQRVLATLRGRDGAGSLTLLDVRFKPSEAMRSGSISDSNSSAASITRLRTTVPVTAGVLGAVLLISGLALATRDRRRRSAER